MYLDVADADTGAAYYRNSLALWNGQNADLKAYIRNLGDTRKPSRPKLEFAYMPSFHKLIVSSDIGILGLDRKLARQARYLAAWFGQAGGEMIGRTPRPLPPTAPRSWNSPSRRWPTGTTRSPWKFRTPPARRCFRSNDTFQQKVFPFENFKLGLEETVVKPYAPIEARGRTFETVGNRLELTDAGLVAGIQNRLVPEEAGREILAGPLSLVATQNGRQVRLGPAEKGFAWGGPARRRRPPARRKAGWRA